MNSISLSIVTFQTALTDLEKVINSIKKTRLNWTLFLIDNSPTDYLKLIAEGDKRIKYIFNNANVGFGAGHNIAMRSAAEAELKYHFVVNPDISFNTDILSIMVEYMQADERIGMMMPEILYPSGEIQYLPKLLPSPWWILLRKLKKPSVYYNRFIDRYELRSVRRDKIYNSPLLSGCFTLINLKSIEEIGGYDEQFFMYIEDWDLSRRVHEKYKTLYFPAVSVIHGYESGANKNLKLFQFYLRSFITYFRKWGWFFDSTRKDINRKVFRTVMNN